MAVGDRGSPGRRPLTRPGRARGSGIRCPSSRQGSSGRPWRGSGAAGVRCRPRLVPVDGTVGSTDRWPPPWADVGVIGCRGLEAPTVEVHRRSTAPSAGSGEPPRPGTRRPPRWQPAGGRTRAARRHRPPGAASATKAEAPLEEGQGQHTGPAVAAARAPEPPWATAGWIARNPSGSAPRPGPAAARANARRAPGRTRPGRGPRTTSPAPKALDACLGHDRHSH